MSNSDEDEDLTLEEVEEALIEIDSKYTKYVHNTNMNKSLMMLLQDFDSLGLPEIDPSLTVGEIHREVVKNSHLLIEMYRRNLSQLDEDELSFRAKDTKYADLQKKLSQVTDNCYKLQQKNKSLEAVIRKLKSDNGELKDMLSAQRSEMQKVKVYYSSKQNELNHSVKKLEKNNQDLKDMFGQDVGKYLAKDEVLANYVKKCKINEDVYKTTIKQLQEKNEYLLGEIVRLKGD